MTPSTKSQFPLTHFQRATPFDGDYRILTQKVSSGYQTCVDHVSYNEAGQAMVDYSLELHGKLTYETAEEAFVAHQTWIHLVSVLVAQFPMVSTRNSSTALS